MGKPKWTAAVIVMAVGLVALAGRAVAQPAPGVVGTWQVPDGDGDPVTLVLEADGSGSLDGDDVRWTLAGGVLTLAMEGATMGYRAVVTETTLQLAGADLRQPLTLRRAAPAAPAGAGGPLVGRWRADTGAVVEFRADGTGQNSRGAFRYAVTDTALVLQEGSAPVAFRYRIEGDRLVLSLPGDTLVFRRTDGAGPAETAAPRP
jgi:hypothetical protein